MESLPVRKTLNHTPPFMSDAAFFFVTICAAERGSSELIQHTSAILEAARHRQRLGKWFIALFLIMPDHLHMLVHVPAPKTRPT